MENNRTMYQRGYEDGGQEMIKRVRELLGRKVVGGRCRIIRQAYLS